MGQLRALVNNRFGAVNFEPIGVARNGAMFVSFAARTAGHNCLLTTNPEAMD